MVPAGRAALRAELAPLRFGALRKRARLAGCDCDAIDDIDDAAGLVQLIIAAAAFLTRRPNGTHQMAAPADLPVATRRAEGQPELRLPGFHRDRRCQGGARPDAAAEGGRGALVGPKCRPGTGSEVKWAERVERKIHPPIRVLDRTGSRVSIWPRVEVAKPRPSIIGLPPTPPP